ncbi:MAG: AAA family ATPase, partial [Acidimicrobiia bacterium]|nr:AAA family ATPase [Acidimicrobiia bacterium]
MSLSETTGVVTLLFTDLVGSTETLARVGDERLEQLRRTHFRLLRGAVASHGGHEVKNVGDGLMVVFPSAVDAMSAAVAVQQGIAHHNAAHPDQPLAVRVGLHVGEPIRDEEDYFGTPVVVAKRLCDAADGGEILVSALVGDLAAGRVSFALSDPTPFALKGFADPLPARRLLWEEAAPPEPGLPPALAGRDESFAGREDELADLTAEWRAVRAGELRVVLLSGEPGIGKTTLGVHFARDVARAGGTVLYGRCDEDALVPYQPLVEAFGQWLSSASDAAVRALPERHAVALSRILPALRERLPGLPEPRTNEPDSERYQLFEAAVELIGAVATDRPVLLMLDDLHWSDKPTLLLAREMTRRLADAPVLLLGTYRDTDLSRTHPLAELLADLRKEKSVLRLPLSGLSPAALERLLAGDATLGAWEKGLARELSRETEGNPLFVREILRHLVETGAIAEEDGRWVPRLELERLGIPEGVKEVIGRRLSRLSEAANRVLRVGAVAGREFDFRLLETVTDVSGDELLDAVDEALATRLLIDVPGRPDRYAFSHALVRETLYDELSTARRLRLHRQIGLALEELSGPDVSARLPELAYHFCEAAPAGEAAKAVDYARQGGDRAMAQLGYEEAVRLYGMALEASEELEGADAVRCELTLALGEARWRAGGIDAARPTFAAAAQMARPLGDPVLLARAALGFAGAGVQFWWIEVGRFNQAVVALLEEALERLPSEDSEWRARCTSCLAQELYFEPGTRERRRQLVDDAIAMARRLGDRPTLAYVLSSGHLAVFSPDVEGDPLHYGEELLELAEELGDRELAFHAHAHRMTMFTT